MWNFVPVNPVIKKAWYSCQPWNRYTAPLGSEEVQIVEDYVTAFSVFKAATRSSAGTTTLTTAPPGGSVSVTDIILSATKVNAATVALNFTDGAQTENLFTITLTNQPVSMTIPIKGRMQGWKDAQLDLVTVNATVAFLTVGYMRLPDGISYSEWDALR